MSRKKPNSNGSNKRTPRRRKAVQLQLDLDNKLADSVLETRIHQPYYFANKLDGIGHTMIIGTTRSHKSSLTNQFISEALKSGCSRGSQQ